MDNGKIELIKSKKLWDDTVGSAISYDFYHTYDYHQISRKPDEEPILIVYCQEDSMVALPLMIRAIDGTSYYDATSVYGYAGPIHRNLSPNVDLNDYRQKLSEFFAEQNIVSVFSRLNPYIADQHTILDGIGSIKLIGSVVNIDLIKSLDEQRSDFRRDTRSRVNKARRLCTVKVADSESDIHEFIEIYNHTMEKLDADSSYFFEEAYFFEFLKSTGFETDILLAVHNESQEVIAGSMFVKTNNIIQYHLSGTKSDYLKIAPSRLLLDEMRIMGTESGFKYFNLGGGYQGKKDALFNFKSSFSNDIKEFNVWTFISNSKVYEELTTETTVQQSSFFPAYRAGNS